MRLILLGLLAAGLINLMSCGQKGPLTVEVPIGPRWTVSG